MEVKMEHDVFEGHKQMGLVWIICLFIYEFTYLFTHLSIGGMSCSCS